MLTRLAITVLVSVTAATWATMLWLRGAEVNPSYFAPFSVAVTVVSGLVFVLERWGWAWPGIRFLTRQPDLRGTWTAEIVSQLRGDENSLSTNDGFMVVRQLLGSVHLRLLTRESQSLTLAASITRESDGVYSIAAIYRNAPRLSVRAASPIHHGGLVLRIEGASLDRMSGEYWTDRETKGEIRLHRLTKRVVNDFDTARSLPTKSDLALKRRLVSQRV